jgi:hypothetical protein
LLISEFDAPLTAGQPGRSPEFVANWTLAQASVRGTPDEPERVSVALDALSVDRLRDDTPTTLGKADHAELHGRIVEGSAANNPVIEVVLRLAAASAPTVHPLLRQPLDADIDAVLRGLPDFSPKSLSAGLKDLQARGGKIEINKARLRQGDIIAVGAGTLGLTARGGLDGQMQITVVGLEKLLKALDIDRLVSQGEIGNAIGALDRLIPGLGDIARQNAAPGIVAGLGALGQSTTLEGKPAIALPLRFVDGTVFLGPLAVGQVPPLF